MTLTLENPPTTVVTTLEWEVVLPTQTNWAQVAVRLHGLLSQTLADEDIDQLIWEAEVGFTTAFVAPLLLAG
jgi:hypothetical protein